MIELVPLTGFRSIFFKAYNAVFISLASKAIHLEAVSGMSAQHFLRAVQRFNGRRHFFFVIKDFSMLRLI